MAHSARGKNVAPCFRQYVCVALKKAAQLGRFCGMELFDPYGHAPSAGGLDTVGVAFDDLSIGRRRDDCLHFCVGRQCGERWTNEIDDELLFVLGQFSEAAAEARLRYPGAGWALHLLRTLPMQTVGHVERLTRRGKLVRYPIRDNVVVGLIWRMQLNQFDPTGPPGSDGFDPGARPQLVACLTVFVATEVAVALHQAETAQLAHRERRGERLLRVDKRTPKPFAIACGNHQAV